MIIRTAIPWHFEGVNPTVSVGILAAIGTATISLITVFVGRYYERRQAVEQAIRDEKIPMYSKMMKGFFATLVPEAQRTGTEADDFNKLLQELNPQIITWASDDVIVTWSRFRRGLASGRFPETDAVFEFERVLFAIRKDYGHTNAKVRTGDLIGLVVLDIDDYLRDGRRISAERPTLSTGSDSAGSDQVG